MRHMISFINNVFRLAAAVVTFSMMVLIVADVVGRSLGAPVVGAVEFTEEYLMVAVVFFAIGYTHTDGGHIRIELFEQWWPAIGRAPVRLTVTAVSLGYFALITWQNVDQVRRALAIGERSSSELAYPIAPAYALVVIGSLVMCLWLLFDLVSIERRSERK